MPVPSATGGTLPLGFCKQLVELVEGGITVTKEGLTLQSAAARPNTCVLARDEIASDLYLGKTRVFQVVELRERDHTGRVSTMSEGDEGR